MLRHFQLTWVAWVLAGCQAVAWSGGERGNPFAAGAQIEVMRELVIPAGLARVYLQHGQALGYEAVDQYAPFCYFLMRRPEAAAQTIAPGTLRVESVSLNETEVRRALPLHLAAALVLAGGDGRGVIALQSYMRLESPDQPQVYALVCSGAFATSFEARPISADQLRETLGLVAQVRAPTAAR
jgi:hypothetical protein